VNEWQTRYERERRRQDRQRKIMAVAAWLWLFLGVIGCIAVVWLFVILMTSLQA
jgi:cell division septal protein FtsQ